jgi:hypothetical protein
MAQEAYITDQSLLAQNPEALDLSRQRKLADLLTGQTFNQPQGNMISGHYVAPSWTQQLAPLVSGIAGQAMNKNLDEKQLKLAEALRGKQQEIMQAWSEAKTPQEKFAIGTSEYAPPQLKSAMYDKLKSQKVGEGESILDYDLSTGGYNPVAQGAMKAAPEVKQAMQMLGINKPLDQLSPQELQAVNGKIDQINASKRAVTNLSVNTGQHGFENTAKLGEMFKSEPIYKTHQEINQAYQQVNAALDKNNAAGDLAASIKINKLLDPNSVVRESEVATVANATGLLPKLQNYANKVVTGASLNPQQRKEYRQLAKDFYAISGNQYNETRNKYSQIGQQNQLNGTDTILGSPWKQPITSNTNLTPAMKNANEILGIPSINGNQ